MKAVMIGLALFLVMGCGRSDAKKPSEELDARNKAWEAEAKGSMSSPAIGSDGTVYVGSFNKKLYSIDSNTGIKLWEFETGSWVTSSPAIGSGDTVYVGSWDKKLYAIKTDSKGPAKSPWPMFGQNAQRTSRASRKE